jgi:hypothetical protein
MPAEVIRDAFTASSFVPFSLRLADGRSFEVSHPDFVSIPPGRPRVVLVYTATDNPEHHRSHWLELGLVAELVALPSLATTIEDRGDE